jgi:PAS domain S-box-containing protein
MQVNLSLLQVLEHLPLLATVTDEHGRFVMVNEAYARWWQAPRHSFEGKNRRETGWPEESARAMEREERQARVANSPLHFLDTVVLADGRSCWLNTVRLPIRFEDGGAGGVLSIAEDVSEKVAVDELLRAIANARAFGEQALPSMLSALAKVARAECVAAYRDAGSLVDCRDASGNACEPPPYASARAMCELPANGRGTRGGALSLHLPAHAPDTPLVQKLMQVVAPVIAEEMERRAAEQQFSDLFESGPDAMLLIGSDGRIALANRQAEALFGYPRDQLLGQPVEALVPAASRAKHAALREGFAAAPHHRSMGTPDSRVTALRQDGTAFPADISLSPLHTAASGLLTVAAVRDLTRRVQTEDALRDLNASLERRIDERTIALQKALEEREALLEAAPSALLLMRDRTIVRCNGHAETMFGYGRGEMVGLPARALYPDAVEYERVTSELYSAPSAGELASAEAAQVRKDGTRFHAIGTRRCLIGGDVVLALTDVTSQRQLADALRSAKEAADAASRMKSSFLATVSHELRTPMNGMLGMLELLALSPLGAEQTQMLSSARESANTLLRLIDDILNLSSIESGSLVSVAAEPISLPELVREACAVHAPAAQRKGVTLRAVAGEPVAQAHATDRIRISQVLNKLLDNAVKFTDAGEIVVRLESLARDREHEHVRLSVSDTGIGIPAEDMGRLFRAFGQLDEGNSRRYGGLGIGLTLCKRLIEALDGHLHVASKPGEGTTVTVELRLRMRQPAMPADAARAEAPAPPGDSPAVLVVEDHPVNLKLLKRQVSMLGYECDTATHGAEAIAKWQSGRYALVLTDCQMPGMDGFELARQIRRLEREHAKSPMPIVACTANAFSEDVKKCLDAGMNDHVAKPVKLDALREKLAAWAPLGARPGGSASAPPVDPRAMSQFSGGDPALEREVLREFLDANGTEVQHLLDAIGAENLRQAELSAHRIKGASGMIGASLLAEAAARLEQAARRADMADVQRLVGELLVQNREVRRHIADRQP